MTHLYRISTIALIGLWAVGCAHTPETVNNPEPVKNTSLAASTAASKVAPDLMAAVEANDLEAVKAAVATGVDLNAKDEAGFTVLVNAMANGNFVIVDFLIQNGAETGLKKPDSEAPNRLLGEGLAQDELLLAAAEAGDLSSVTRLVEAGANVNARSEDGFTVLVHAISGYHREVIQYLVEKGATIHH